MTQPSNAILTVLVGVGLVAGAACLALTRAAGPFGPSIVPQNVERVNASAIPDPVPGERFVPYVWRFQDLYARRGEHWVPRTAREVGGGPVLTWDGIAKYLQVAADRGFTGDRRHWAIDAASLRLPEMYAGMNFWRVSLDGVRWSTAREFEVEPEFLSAPPVVRAGDLITLEGFDRFVVEYSADETFTDARAIVIDGNHVRIGARGYVRARGLNARDEVSALSAARPLP